MSYKKNRIYMRDCEMKVRRQIWKQTELNDIRLSPKSCLEASQRKQWARIGKCHEMGGTQHWTFDSQVWW